MVSEPHLLVATRPTSATVLSDGADEAHGIVNMHVGRHVQHSRCPPQHGLRWDLEHEMEPYLSHCGSAAAVGQLTALFLRASYPRYSTNAQAKSAIRSARSLPSIR